MKKREESPEDNETDTKTQAATTLTLTSNEQGRNVPREKWFHSDFDDHGDNNTRVDFVEQVDSPDSKRGQESDLAPADTQHSKKRSKTSGFSTKMLPDDGFQWHKYGQKSLMDGSFSRAYYRCAQRVDGCTAKKTVDVPLKAQQELCITYDGTHNHSSGVSALSSRPVVVCHKGQEDTKTTPSTSAGQGISAARGAQPAPRERKSLFPGGALHTALQSPQVLPQAQSWSHSPVTDSRRVESGRLQSMHSLQDGSWQGLQGSHGQGLQGFGGLPLNTFPGESSGLQMRPDFLNHSGHRTRLGDTLTQGSLHYEYQAGQGWSGDGRIAGATGNSPSDLPADEGLQLAQRDYMAASYYFNVDENLAQADPRNLLPFGRPREAQAVPEVLPNGIGEAALTFSAAERQREKPATSLQASRACGRDEEHVQEGQGETSPTLVPEEKALPFRLHQENAGPRGVSEDEEQREREPDECLDLSLRL